MQILRLDRLLPGDLILETGVPMIANATSGPYGHASVALGKLVKIEAESFDGGVVFNPFEFKAWHRDEERIVGVPVDSEMIVLRKPDLDIGTVDGEALWEAGRLYSPQKLLELPDLDPRYRPILERWLKSSGKVETADLSERFCSEVAARILQLPISNLSPNALAQAKGLEPVLNAIEKIGENWIPESAQTAKTTLDTHVAKVRCGLAEWVLKQADLVTEEVKNENRSVNEAAAALELILTEELQDAIAVLQEIRALEPTILHGEIARI